MRIYKGSMSLFRTPVLRGLVLHVLRGSYLIKTIMSIYRGGGKLNFFKRGRIFWVLVLHVFRR